MREQQTPESDGVQGKQQGRMTLLVVLVVSLVLGGALGAVLIGPRMAGASSKSGAEAGQGAGEEQKKKEKDSHGPETLYALESLVVNPAGTSGTRFLIVSLAINAEGGAEILKPHEAKLRDVLLNVLARKSVEELADITQRDALKQEMVEAIAGAVGVKVRELYFPQFVLQ